MEKHTLAEKFKGLYSPEIDNMVNIINKMTTELHTLNAELLNDPDNKDKLMEYYELSTDINEMFETIHQRANEIEDEEEYD